MWRQLRARLGATNEQTAACFVLIEQDLYAMASQGLPTTLYRPNGLRPCPKIKRMIGERVDFRRVHMDKLSEYAAHRFIVLIAKDERSIRYANQLLHAAVLHKHAAHVHLEEAKWNYDDAYTRDRLPDMLSELLHTSIAPRESFPFHP